MSFKLFTSVSEPIRIKMTDLHQRIPAREQINPPHWKSDAVVVPAAAHSSHNNRVVAIVSVVDGGSGDATGLVLPAL
jgi:hypothetical protein